MRRLLIVLVTVLFCAGTSAGQVGNSGLRTFVIYGNGAACGSVVETFGQSGTCSAFSYQVGETIAPFAGTLQNLRCSLLDTVSSFDTGDGMTFTVIYDDDGHNNGSGLTVSAVTCDTPTTESQVARGCDDLVNTASVAAGALISFKVTLTATPPDSYLTCSVELEY